jgi:hypothetical protein
MGTYVPKKVQVPVYRSCPNSYSGIPVNKLFEFCNFPIPADLSDKENMSAKHIHAQEQKETIARCRSPLRKEMLVVMAKLATESDQDSAKSMTFDWFCLCRVAGFRVSEYAQTTQSKVDEHE